MKVIEQNKYNFLTTAKPTYWPTDPRKTPDVLDLFITRGLTESYLEITASYDLQSDHSPIIATISESIITTPPPPHLHTRTTNWAKYKELIQQGANLNLRRKPHTTSKPLQTRSSLSYNKQRYKQLRHPQKACIRSRFQWNLTNKLHKKEELERDGNAPVIQMINELFND